MLAEIARFVGWVRRRNPEARTWKDYGYDLKIFVQVVGDRPPGEVDYRDVDRFIAQQSERGFKPSTINRRVAALISFYAYLSVEDDRLVCPVHHRRHHLRQPQRLPRPVPEDDLRKFFDVIPDETRVIYIRDRAMFALMLRCGLRIAEVASLQMADLYLDEDFPRLIVRGKGSRERSLFLSPQALRALREYQNVRPSAPSDCVFLSYLLRGMSTTAIHKRLMRYREQAVLVLSAHRFRHTFGTDLNKAKVPVTTIQKLLGHRWIETTLIYIMANDQEVAEDYYAACPQIEGWGS